VNDSEAETVVREFSPTDTRWASYTYCLYIRLKGYEYDSSIYLFLREILFKNIPPFDPFEQSRATTARRPMSPMEPRPIIQGDVDLDLSLRKLQWGGHRMAARYPHSIV
jgi:hypothetical protein